ncbi:MAG: type II toxin-antitoxin system RatA family toxin [Litorivicinus sp.]
MKTIAKTALVFHSAEQMFDVVDDVERYPDFLPWCAGATVLEKTSSQMVAELNLAKGRLRHAFTTRNDRVRPESITLSLVEGPFKHFHGEWTFTPKTDGACEVALNLSFDMGGKLTAMALGPVFTQVANTMVGAFCDRADEIYA